MIVDEVTKKRAYTVFEITKELLMEGDQREEISDSYRFSYLILRGPKKFLETFGSGNLYLDYNKISDGYFLLSFDLVGPKGLTAEEEYLIYVHNDEVNDLMIFNSQSFVC